LGAEVGVLGVVGLVWALLWLAWPLVRGGVEAKVAPAACWLRGLGMLMLGLDTLTLLQTWVGIGVVMAVGGMVSSPEGRRSV